MQDTMLALAEEPRCSPTSRSPSHCWSTQSWTIDDRTVTKTSSRASSCNSTRCTATTNSSWCSSTTRRRPTLEFTRWLPHTWSDDRSARFVATNESDVKRLTGMFEPGSPHAAPTSAATRAHPTSAHTTCCLRSTSVWPERTTSSAAYLSRRRPRARIVALYDKLPALPKECRAVVEAGRSVARIYDRQDTTGASRAFRPDISPAGDTRNLAVCLANTQLDTMSDAFVLPGMISFLELHGVGKVEHLNLLTRSKESNPVLTLEAAVGVGANGEQLSLDVHEKRHGPHGLIAGMTGSGKSEFIMTYILSLAITYSPSEVAFVLIDYKGGGMANAFADLPHVAGTITNLDGAAVNRSLISIQSELKRRQAIFNDAGAATGTSNIDIYKYQSLYRDGAVSEPLPHLFDHLRRIRRTEESATRVHEPTGQRGPHRPQPGRPPDSRDPEALRCRRRSRSGRTADSVSASRFRRKPTAWRSSRGRMRPRSLPPAASTCRSVSTNCSRSASRPGQGPRTIRPIEWKRRTTTAWLSSTTLVSRFARPSSTGVGSCSGAPPSSWMRSPGTWSRSRPRRTS